MNEKQKRHFNRQYQLRQGHTRRPVERQRNYAGFTILLLILFAIAVAYIDCGDPYPTAVNRTLTKQ